MTPSTYVAVSLAFAFLLTMPVYAVVARRRPVDAEVARRPTTIFLGLWVRDWLMWVITPVERSLVRMRVSPDLLNYGGGALGLAAGVSYSQGAIALGGSFVLLGGLADVLDGRVARARGMGSDYGEFLDSIIDRFSEMFVFVGLALYFEPSWWAMVSTVVAMGGSMMVSYSRAKGEAVGVDCQRRRDAARRAPRAARDRVDARQPGVRLLRLARQLGAHLGRDADRRGECGDGGVEELGDRAAKLRGARTGKRETGGETEQSSRFPNPYVPESFSFLHEIPQHVLQYPAIPEVQPFLRRIDPAAHLEDFLPPSRVAVTVSVARGASESSRPAMSKLSKPVRPSVARVSPGMNSSGSTPMPTRLERWMRSKLSAITARTPSRHVPLAAQSRELTGAVFLAGDHDRAACPPSGIPRRRRRSAAACRRRVVAVTPPSVPGASSFRRRMFAKVPRIITS